MGAVLHLALDAERRAAAEAAEQPLARLPQLGPACPKHDALEALTSAGFAARCATLALQRGDLTQGRAEIVQARRKLAVALMALERAQ